jgi:hypothetical protein
MSICFLIASIGKPSLKNTLRSMYGQFDWNDKFLVYFDGRCDAGIDYFRDEQDLYGANLEMIMLQENLGYWGHGIRNKYLPLIDKKFTHIHNMDDDDGYNEGVFFRVRNDIINNPDKVLIYKFKNHNGITVWQNQSLVHGNIGTPSGIFPNKPELFGRFSEGYGGDAEFYIQTCNNFGMENVIFKDLEIVRCRPT